MNPMQPNPGPNQGAPAPSPTGYGAPAQPQQPVQQQPAYGAPPMQQPAQAYAGGQPQYGAPNYGGMPQQPKKKTGLIIGICAAVVAVAGIAVALILLLRPKTDVNSILPGSPITINSGLWADLSDDVGSMGEEGFSFTYTNNHSAELEYLQVALYCYDRNGNPIYDEYDENFEFVPDSPYIGAGEKHTPQKDGYWTFEYHSNVAYAIPVIVYAEFADGYVWDGTGGIATESSGYSAELSYYLNDLAREVDAIAAEEL